jgi:hypothetical protein
MCIIDEGASREEPKVTSKQVPATMYACMYVRMCVYMYLTDENLELACIHTCICIHAYVYACIDAYVHACMYACKPLSRP